MRAKPLSRIMPAFLRRAAFAILLALGSLSSVGQIYVWTGWTDSTPREVYDWSWVVGSKSFHVGLMEQRYWKDRAGREIALQLAKNSSGQWILKAAPAAMEHRRTVVYLGPLSLTLPMPKLAVAIIGCAALLAVVAWGWGRRHTRHERADDAAENHG